MEQHGIFSPPSFPWPSSPTMQRDPSQPLTCLYGAVIYLQFLVPYACVEGGEVWAEETARKCRLCNSFAVCLLLLHQASQR